MIPSSSTPSYSSKNYALLLLSQFFGAFGDNALLAVIVGQLTYLQQSGMISAGQLRSMSTLYASLLFIPYVLLAPLAGFLNDRYAKTRWLAGGNALKLAGTVLCAWSVHAGPLWQGIGYFVVGIGACIYGPAKYGILPEILPRERLVRANGLVELLTLLAILSGAIAGSLLSDQFHDQALKAYAVVTAVFAGALVFSWGISATPMDSTIRFKSSLQVFFGHTRDLLRAPRLARMLMGTALFWICGATMKTNFQPWGLEVLGFSNNTEIALLGLWLSVGVMIGSVVAGRLHYVGDLRRTRVYGGGLATLLAVLSLVAPSTSWLRPTLHLGTLAAPLPVVGLLIVTGIAAGLFLIPLNAALQAESDPNKLGKTIAVQNLFDNLGMCLAAGYVFVAARAELSSGRVFLGLALGVAAAMVIFRFVKNPDLPAARGVADQSKKAN